MQHLLNSHKILNVQYHGEDGLVVEYFSFSSSIADHLKSASLVISHAGKTPQVSAFILYCPYNVIRSIIWSPGL